MDQLVILLDSQGHVLEANPTALNHFGLERKDVPNTPLWSLKCWQISREVNNKLRRAIRSVASGEVLRYETEIAQGSQLECRTTLDLSLKPLRDESGTVVSVLVEARDITERKKAEREVERKTEEHRVLYEQLKEFDQLKTQFFANVSHELRTPLDVDSGAGPQIVGMPASDSERFAKRCMSSNATRACCCRRVNNLLDLSKLEANEMLVAVCVRGHGQLGRLVGLAFRNRGRGTRSHV